MFSERKARSASGDLAKVHVVRLEVEAARAGVALEVVNPEQHVDVGGADGGRVAGDPELGGDVAVAHFRRRQVRDRVVGVRDPEVPPGLGAHEAREDGVADPGCAKGVLHCAGPSALIKRAVETG